LVELAKKATEKKPKPREMKSFERGGSPGAVQRSLDKYTDGPIEAEPEDLGDVDAPEEDEDSTGAVKFVKDRTSPETKEKLRAAAQKAKDFYHYEVAPRVERFEKSDYADRVKDRTPKRVAEAVLEPGDQEEARERLKLRSMTPEQREGKRLDGRIAELERISARKREMDEEREADELRKRLEKRGF
jgi:hypothetical protein